MTTKLIRNHFSERIITTANKWFKKIPVQYSNKYLYFVSSALIEGLIQPLRETNLQTKAYKSANSYT